MNIEQLENGKKIRDEIDELNQTQKELIQNFKECTEKYKTQGISISFEEKETYKVVSIPMSDETRLAVFNLINNWIMREITNKETEFLNL